MQPLDHVETLREVLSWLDHNSTQTVARKLRNLGEHMFGAVALADDWETDKAILAKMFGAKETTVEWAARCVRTGANKRTAHQEPPEQPTEENATMTSKKSAPLAQDACNRLREHHAATNTPSEFYAWVLQVAEDQDHVNCHEARQFAKLALAELETGIPANEQVGVALCVWAERYRVEQPGSGLSRFTDWLMAKVSPKAVYNASDSPQKRTSALLSKLTDHVTTGTWFDALDLAKLVSALPQSVYNYTSAQPTKTEWPENAEFSRGELVLIDGQVCGSVEGWTGTRFTVHCDAEAARLTSIQPEPVPEPTPEPIDMVSVPRSLIGRLDVRLLENVETAQKAADAYMELIQWLDAQTPEPTPEPVDPMEAAFDQASAEADRILGLAQENQTALYAAHCHIDRLRTALKGVVAEFPRNPGHKAERAVVIAKDALARDEACPVCEGRKTVRSIDAAAHLPGAFVRDCPACCGEEG